MTFHIDNVFYPADRRKICYGVNIHILQSGQLIVLFLRQARFAVFVSCVWKFSGKMFYCNPDDSRLLFAYKSEHRKACTNLIQFDKGFSFFCAVSDNMLEKITYLNNEHHVKLIRTKSASLFLKENSNIILITNDTSSRAGFYEMNIFDSVYMEQLANNVDSISLQTSTRAKLKSLLDCLNRRNTLSVSWKFTKKFSEIPHYKGTCLITLQCTKRQQPVRRNGTVSRGLTKAVTWILKDTKSRTSRDLC
uniref:DUF295 domain-containing protein n=1 Tax=Loa loa TaxID=7209 RepID=A0A1I7VUR9_LOALO